MPALPEIMPRSCACRQVVAVVHNTPAGLGRGQGRDLCERERSVCVSVCMCVCVGGGGGVGFMYCTRR